MQWTQNGANLSAKNADNLNCAFDTGNGILKVPIRQWRYLRNEGAVYLAFVCFQAFFGEAQADDAIHLSPYAVG
jgi:hypothetical protein